MRINHNIAALNTYRQLNTNSANGAKSLERLSSGLRINKAGDDAAGLAISEKMRGQIRGLDQATRNSQDAISLIQTAEGALSETHSILQRMRELGVQAANSTNAGVDRGEIQNEMNQLTSEINRIANFTEFNTKSLLNGKIAISGDGRAVSSGATYGTGMSSLVVQNTSSMDIGDYKIAVTNETEKIVANGQSGNIAEASVTQEAVKIGEGSYRINVTNEANVKEVSSTTDAGSLLTSDGVNIYSGSSLANVAHTIDVAMETERTVTNVNSGGISTINADATEVGNYTISTSANVAGATIVETEGLYKTDDSGAIKDITIGNDSTLSGAGNLKISVDQMTSTAESFNTAHIVEQGLTFRATDSAKLGTDLSIKLEETGVYQENTEVSVNGAGDIVVKLATDMGGAAKLVEQGLTFEAKVAGEAGNDINIEFVSGAATAVSTSAGNNITITLTAAEKSSVNVDGITIEAEIAGTEWDGAEINFVAAGGASASTSVAYDGGNKFTVTLGTDGTSTINATTQDIMTALTNNTTFADNYTAIGGDATATTLTGILAETVTTAGGGNATTTEEIAALIAGDATATALVTVTGGNTTAATATTGATNLAGGGADAIVTATMDDIKAAFTAWDPTNSLVSVDVTTGTGSDLATGFAATKDFIDGSTEPQTTFSFTLKNDTKTFGEATATFSNSSGSTTIQLGDVSFTVDNSDMFTGDTAFDAKTIALTVDNLMRVTDSDGNYAELSQNDNVTASAVTFSSWKDADDVAIVSTNEIEMDIDTNDIGAGGFIRGNSYYINVDSTDKYTVQLNNAGGAIGDAIEFTRDDLANKSTYTNVALGDMNSGLYANFDVDALAALVDGDAKQIAVTIGTTDAYVAQLQKADGSDVLDADGNVVQTMTLKDGDPDQTINLGEGVEFAYSSDGTQLSDISSSNGGQHYFSVKAGQDNYEITLTFDPSGTNESVGSAVSFDKGDTVTFGDTGLSIKTANTIVDGEESSFSIEDTTINNSIVMQIGANHGQSMSIDVNDMRAAAIKISGGEDQEGATVISKSGAKAAFTKTQSVTNGTSGKGVEYALDVSTYENASAAIDVLTDAIGAVSSERSKLGSFQNRLEYTINNLGTSAENLTAAESRIRDVDMAKEMMEFTKNNILSQAAQAMLAQANQQPQGVLQLLR